MKLFVEGGGNTAALKTECREGFAAFITKAGIRNRPRVVACGSRHDAYDSFCTAIAQGEEAMLLVDSEAPVSDQYQQGEPENWLPWQHLKDRIGDGWDRKGNDKDCHLMVEAMENWFLADRNNLRTFFGNNFRENKLPAATRPIENITKIDVYRALSEATQNCTTKAEYSKGNHSFKLLRSISPDNVTQHSPWAKRFIDELKKRMDR